MLEIRESAFGTPDFEACMAIRMRVFVDEQKVPADEERDAYDLTARHFLALAEGAAAGTARVIFPNGPELAKITRVAVLAPQRGSGIGAALLRHIMHVIPTLCFTLDSQLHAMSFYETLGFTARGEVFYEAGMPHRVMSKTKLSES
jgi:predicted GNAT family N-acyltransferase